jgi:hypothetical protein
MGISSILVVTVGGFARLTPTILVAIIALTVLGPIVVTRYFAWKARREVRTPAAPTPVAG